MSTHDYDRLTRTEKVVGSGDPAGGRDVGMQEFLRSAAAEDILRAQYGLRRPTPLVTDPEQRPQLPEDGQTVMVLNPTQDAIAFQRWVSGRWVPVIAGATPVTGGFRAGMVIAWSGAAVPSDFALCDGDPGGVITSALYPDLAAVLPVVAGKIQVPDLRDRFVVAAGSTYGLRAAGGEASHLLTAAESGMVGHSHGGAVVSATTGVFTQPESAMHTHNMNQGWYYAARGTPVDWTVMATPGASAGPPNVYNYNTGYEDANHTHAITDSGHVHTINPQAAANAGAAHNNTPLYYALYYIIALKNGSGSPAGPMGPMGPVGPQGPAGLGGYTFTQASAANPWVIAHSLGRFPSVTIVDSGGHTIIPDVTYDSNNQVTVTFSAVTSGVAYLN